MKAIEAAAKTLREKLFNAIWRCGFAPDEDPAVIEAKKAEWPDDVRAAYRRADACLSVITALAEDDAAVEAVARALRLAEIDMSVDELNSGWTIAAYIRDPKAAARAAIRAMGGE